jgi:hypothetical protein
VPEAHRALTIVAAGITTEEEQRQDLLEERVTRELETHQAVGL